MRLFKNTNVDFLGIKWWMIGLSLVLAILGTVSLLLKGGPRLGIDFTGGSQLLYAFKDRPDENAIRKIVETANVKLDSAQRFDKPEKNQVLLRIPMEQKEGRDIAGEVTRALSKAMFPKGSEPGAFDLNLNGGDLLLARLLAEDPEKISSRPSLDPKTEYQKTVQAIIAARSAKGLFHSIDDVAKVPGVSPAVAAWLKEKTVVGPFTMLQAENVGPQVGRDLRRQGLWAVALSWAAMLAYVGIRFRSASFGTAAVVAIIHDTWITLGLCSLLSVEISLTVVAAFLTLIGYSMNDTVVVYDRIRENLQKTRKKPLPEIVNESINQTLSRTVLTSGLTFLVVVALFFLGGEVLRPFSFVMLVGIIIGTYSSIFIAAPLVIVWEEWKAKRSPKKPAGEAAAPKGGRGNGRKG
ncbi:MAG TPA: protein translocase subunit SecF [Thermoanaerobaculia bacterium]|nr:protein translocase subunit SecF [Thermoanaerobaculia bacterium]HQR67575.1 protein translocase subunit SecF [Thermoanaerobaculia bacterium]